MDTECHIRLAMLLCLFVHTHRTPTHTRIRTTMTNQSAPIEVDPAVVVYYLFPISAKGC